MRHGKRLLKLGKKSKPRRRLLRNLVTSLVEHERIITTRAKARAMCGLADKVISIAKKSNLTLEQRKKWLMGILYRKDAVDKVINDLLPRYEAKPGNYTIARHSGYRKGDNAKMSIVEYHGNNYFLYEQEGQKDTYRGKYPEFTLKVLREESSFFTEALEKAKTSPDGAEKQKFLERQLERVQRELAYLDKSEIHIA